MKKAVLRGFILTLIVALIICGVVSAVIFGIKQTNAKRDELLRIVRIVSEQFDPDQSHNDQAHAIAATLGHIRVTIIDADGNVTGDSDVDFTTMENHRDREEIMAARGTITAVSIRKSTTIGTRLMYAVVRTPESYYIRLSEEYSGIGSDLVSFLPAVSLAALLSLLVAFLLANKFSNNTVVPIINLNNGLIGVKDGSVTLNPNEYPYDELRDMADKINALAADISTHIGKLQEEKDRIDFILDNMKEGFILFDNKQNILLINNSACTYLKCNKKVIGEHILHCTQNLSFLQTAEAVLKEDHIKFIDLRVGGKIIEAEFTAVGGKCGINGGIIVIMTDVTENRNAIKMRRDFFSNASHELKTPITSIKGSAELLCADIPLEEEQQKELLTRIGLEAERMCSLINDIIMINRLESGDMEGLKHSMEGDHFKEDIDVADIVRECCDEVMPLIEQNELSMDIHTDSAFVYASRKDIYEMVSNLIINAVKYNRLGGSINVNLKSYHMEGMYSAKKMYRKEEEYSMEDEHSKEEENSMEKTCSIDKEHSKEEAYSMEETRSKKEAHSIENANSIRRWNESVPTENIVLTVHNDGEYISPDHQHRVFERFYRVDKGRSKTVGGTGLGLSIVKHIVDSLGGVISLESDREKGTTFTVIIPRK